jgi:S-DNA-T family DNA segregation ATPase FtsK/SpoIIIE
VAEPKRNTIKNTIKEDVVEGNLMKDSKAKKEKPAFNPNNVSFKDKINNLFEFARNEKFQKIIGLFLLLLSVYSAIAFTSFIFTWQADQDKVLGDLFANDVVVENWLGKFGALLLSLIHI